MRLWLLGFLFVSLTTGEDEAECFCGVCGPVYQCPCTVEQVDARNSDIFLPKLLELVKLPFFRYFRANLDGACPVWSDEDELCSAQSCAVKTCTQQEVEALQKLMQPPTTSASAIKQRCEEMNDISWASDMPRGDAEARQASDEAIQPDSYCLPDEQLWDISDLTYVDLLANPERYTGYGGASAQRVWRAVYDTNCFVKESLSLDDPLMQFAYGGHVELEREHDVQQIDTELLCEEERMFYRLLSGIHTSISLHLTYKWLDTETETYKPNAAEFARRFDHEQGREWLQNLYFAYLTVQRAVVKGAAVWEQYPFFAADTTTSRDTRQSVLELLNTASNCDRTFDEDLLFQNEGTTSQQLHEQLRQHMIAVSKTMNCVGCRKCRLWGKLQTRGLATALRILFKADASVSNLSLAREDVVAIFNLWERLASSISYFKEFSQLN